MHAGPTVIASLYLRGRPGDIACYVSTMPAMTSEKIIGTLMNLLIVDDDPELRELLTDLLQKYGYEVQSASNGQEMFAKLATQHIDLIILDIRLPGEDGFSLCQKLRLNSMIPIIMLTANGDETDRIVGLEMGADDYLPKPFNPRELVARIKAVLRRFQEGTLALKAKDRSPFSAAILKFAGWRLELAGRRLISPDNLEIALSAGEYTLLLTFLERPRRVLSRDKLLELTHNREATPFDRSIDIQVSRLRQKLEDDPKNPKFIRTVRGGGYVFHPHVEKVVIHD